MTELLHAGEYFGTRLRARDQGSFALQLTRYAAGELLPAHTHELPYVCFVVDGDYHEHVGGAERACSAGTVVVHRGGAQHSDRFGARGGTCLNIAWDPAGGAELVRRAGRALPVGAWRAPRIAELCSDLVDAATSRARAREDFVRARMHELGEELAAASARAERREDEPRWLARVEAEIEACVNRADTTCDVASLARAAGLHRTTLLRAFWRHRGSNVSEAVRKKQLERAIGAITHTDVSLADVAHLAGYADQSHLCRTLRAATGTSPARLRRQAKAGAATTESRTRCSR